MWKKASLPLMLLLLLLLIALLLAQLVATESTKPSANANDTISNNASSTDHSGSKALDINYNGDHDLDEAIVETYDDDEESSEVKHKATPLSQFIMKTSRTNKEKRKTNVGASDDGEVMAENVGVAEVNVPDDDSSNDYNGSGGGVGVDIVGEGNVGDVAAIDDDENVDSDEISESALLDIRERKRLASIMLRELSKLIDYALEQQRLVVNQFLQDETIEMVKCETMEMIKKSCTAFMTGVSNALQMDKGEDLLGQLAQFGVKTLIAFNFETFVQEHNTTRIKQPTAENVIIYNALKKAGMLEIEVELQKRFVEFLNFFNKTVNEYVKRQLPQQQESNKLVLWYREYAASTNINSQAIVLSKFLPMYKKILLDAMKEN